MQRERESEEMAEKVEGGVGGSRGISLSLSPPLSLLSSPQLSSAASGFRGNITRKWWLACECRYHFLARYQPALPVITAPPGLRHGLLDKPPTAKVYCLFHLPQPFCMLLLLLRSPFSVYVYVSVSVSLFPCLCTPPLAILATLQPLPTLGRCIELFENRPKRREITWENGYVVRSRRPIASKRTVRSILRRPSCLHGCLPACLPTGRPVGELNGPACSVTGLLQVARIIGRRRLGSHAGIAVA